MAQYILKGIVHPERAQLSIGPIKLPKTIQVSTKKELSIELNIVLNHISIWIETTKDWDIFDLRNIARYISTVVCSFLTFTHGYYYEVEIIQILSKEKGIDYVFGIDTPCVSERNSVEIWKKNLIEIQELVFNKNGLYFQRCFKDLNLALKDTEDTVFYCFRAIESLKQYCKEKFNISKEKEQWEKVSEISGFNKEYIEDIRNEAFPLRHGSYSFHTSEEREKFLTKTWNVVEGFLKNILSI